MGAYWKKIISEKYREEKGGWRSYKVREGYGGPLESYKKGMRLLGKQSGIFCG